MSQLYTRVQIKGVDPDMPVEELQGTAREYGAVISTTGVVDFEQEDHADAFFHPSPSDST